jgi:hypothetical protein
MQNINKCWYLLICSLFISVTFTHAQSNQLDVDRLYARYKGQTETTIFVGDKEVNAHVLINYNGNNKPYRVIIYGEVAADTELEELIDQLGSTKQKAGYKRLAGNNTVNLDQNGVYENNIGVKVFQKGTQYAKYGIKPVEARNQLVQENGTEKYTADLFYFEVGDSARKRTRKPEKFDF